MNKLQHIARNIMLCLSLLPTLFSCSDDKGNYTYGEKTIITIEGIPSQLDYLSGADYIDLKPVITSNIEGTISGDNENFEFLYQKKDSEGNWKDMGNEKDLHLLMNFDSGNYICRYVVTDKRTGVQTMQLFYIQSKTITTEGWMVLCNEGEEERVRLDMLSQISPGRVIPTHDIIQKADGVPELYHATQLGYLNSNLDGNIISLLSETNAYTVETTDGKGRQEFTSIKEYNKLTTDLFLSQTSDHIVYFSPVAGSCTYYRPDAAICISSEGNAYAWNTSAQNTGFEYAINTSIRGNNPEYRVAPFVGSTTLRPAGQPCGVALLYDIDNHRFIGWVGDSEAKKQICQPLEDPANKLFSFNTGGMKLVSMISSPSSQGIAYCIMQDGAKRHLYCINVSTKEFNQERCCLDIQAPDFDKAICFTANIYPVIYYAYRNKVYVYNYATNVSKEVITLGQNEEVTMIKFNHIDYAGGIGGLSSKISAEMRAIYTEREKELIVGSYDNSATDGNGGILRFYKVDDNDSGMRLGLKVDLDENEEMRRWEFSGYARIKDVRYKEPQ